MIQVSESTNSVKNIQADIDCINNHIDRQTQIVEKLLSITHVISSNFEQLSSDNVNENIYTYINLLTEKMIKANHLLNDLNLLKEMLTDFQTSYDTYDDDDIQDFITRYNKKYLYTTQEVLSNTISITKLEKDLISKSIISSKDIISCNSNNKSSNKKESNPDYSDLLENTLLISEPDQVVVLPYKIKDLEKILSETPNEYSSIKDVILKKYTIPLQNYRFSFLSRFRETYKLVMERDNKNLLKAVSLSLELSTNYVLHPAIITACKNLDELDIYLSCLEDDKLDDFQLFKIKFVGLPTIVKNDKTLLQM